MAYHNPQESLVSSTQDRTSSWLKAVDESRSVSDASENDSLINSHGIDRSLATADRPEQCQSFPWLSAFSARCAELVDKKVDLPILQTLLTDFVLTLPADVNECYKKPNRAAKLKKVVNEYLLFFHMLYLDIKEPLEHLPYLNKMSDLLAMYVDLEIKASRKGKEYVKVICGRLTAALFIFLRYSMDHILDTMLKTRLMAKSSMEISMPVLSRVLRNKPIQPMCEMTYVRYILVYKLWKKIVKGAEERRKVNRQASALLIPPEDFKKIVARGTVLDGILPNIPKSCTGITQFFMQAKFSVKEKARAFLKISQDPQRPDVSDLLPDLDRSLFLNNVGETTHFAGDNNEDGGDDGSASLLDEMFMSSMSSNDMMMDDVFACLDKRPRLDTTPKKRKPSNDILSKKVAKKKLKSKELKLTSSPDSLKKQKQNDGFNNLFSSPFMCNAKEKKKKYKKEVTGALNKLKMSKKNKDKLSTVVSDKIEKVKNIETCSLLKDNDITGVKNKVIDKIINDKTIQEEPVKVDDEEEEDDDDEEEDDDDDDDVGDENEDEYEDTSSISVVTCKEETQSQGQDDKDVREVDCPNFSFSNNLQSDKDKNDKALTDSQKDSESRIVNEKDKNEEKSTTVDNNTSTQNTIVEETENNKDGITLTEMDKDKSDKDKTCNYIVSENNVVLIDCDDLFTPDVDNQSVPPKTNDDISADKSNKMNQIDDNSSGSTFSLQIRKDLQSETNNTEEVVNDEKEDMQEELPIVNPPPVGIEEVDNSVPLIPKVSDSLLDDDNMSTSSDCIIEGIIEAPRNSLGQPFENLIIKEDVDAEPTGNINFEEQLASISARVPQNNEEYIRTLLQQWPLDENYHDSFDPTYLIDTGSYTDINEDGVPCTYIMTDSIEGDTILRNRDPFFGIYEVDQDGRDTSENLVEQERDPGIALFDNANIADGNNMTFSNSVQSPVYPSTSATSPTSNANIQTSMSDSETQTNPASNNGTPNSSSDHFASPSSSPSTANIHRLSPYTPVVSLSRSDVERRRTGLKTVPTESSNYKKGVKRKGVTFKDSEEPPNKQSLVEESRKTNDSVNKEKESKNSRKDREDRSSSTEILLSNSSKETRDSNDTRTPSSSNSRGKGSSSRRTRKGSDLQEPFSPNSQLEQDNCVNKEKSVEREKESDNNMADDKKRSRSTKQTKHDSAASSGNNNNNNSSSAGGGSSSSSSSNSRRHRGSSQKQSKKKDDNPDLDFAHCLLQLQQSVGDQKSESDTNIERVTCSAVKIGSYRAVPHGPVIFTSHCIDIEMPSLNDSNSTTKLRIPYSQMVKIFVHYYRSGPVFFMYATAPMGTKIRDTLKMNSKSGPYYDPLSKVETQKRIILFTERISEDIKSKIKSILNNVSKNLFEEFSNREATDVLNVCAPDEVQHMFKKSQSTQAAAPVISKGSTKKISTQTIMMYPPSPSKGSISISVQDYSCLGEDQCVNEVIVDFYLKYLMENVLSSQDKGRTYLLSSSFYKQLINDFSNKGLSNSSEDEPLAIYTEKRHSSRIKRITKSVNVFTKDFIIVPVCSKNLSWMVAIICFPHLTGPVKFHGSSINSYASSKSKRKHSALIEDFPNKDTNIRSDIDTEEDEGYDVHEGWDEQGGCLDEKESHDKLKHNDHRSSNNNSNSSNNNNSSSHKRHSNSKSSSNKSNSSSKLSSHDAIRQPCILVFDPTASCNKTQVVSLLRDYLRIEYKANYGYDRDFSETALKSVSPKVPLLTNNNDSGLYVLQYVQSFFQNPITDFRLPINMLQNWFTPDVITYKRYELQKLLHRLMEKQDVDIVSLNLPDLNLQSPVGAVETESEYTEDKDDDDEDYNCGESMECDDDEEEEEEGEEDEDDSESEETVGKNSLRRTRKSSDLEQNQQDRTSKDKDKSEKETEAPERENKDKKKSHSSKQPSKHKSSSSRSSKRSSSSQKQQKRKATGGRGSLDEMPYNPPKTRLTALREKEDAAAQMEHQSSSNVDQPRRSPKKNML